MSGHWELLDHTADKAIEVYADSLEEVFELSAYAMFSLMAELDRYQPETERILEIGKPSSSPPGQGTLTPTPADLPDLLVTWLNDLIYLFEVEGFLPLKFYVLQVNEREPYLKARVEGRAIRPDIEWLGAAVKAATYHNLVVEKTDQGWYARYVVDV